MQQVGMDKLRLAQLTQVPLGIMGMNAGFSHQASHSLVIRQKTQRKQIILHLKHPMSGMEYVMLIHQLHHGQVFIAFSLGCVIYTRFADSQ